jgi:hypothetical protein
MDLDMQHGLGHAEWIWTYSIDMDMQHEHGLEHAALTWTCSMDMDMDKDRHRKKNINMQHRTWTCSIDLDMQRGHGYVAWIRTCSMDLDKQYRLDTQHGFLYVA